MFVEKGLADWVIQAQVGHVAPAMMKTYSYIRRQALNEVADALEPRPSRHNLPAPSDPLSGRLQPYRESRHSRPVGPVVCSDLLVTSIEVGLDLYGHAADPARSQDSRTPMDGKAMMDLIQPIARTESLSRDAAL